MVAVPAGSSVLAGQSTGLVGGGSATRPTLTHKVLGDTIRQSAFRPGSAVFGRGKRVIVFVYTYQKRKLYIVVNVQMSAVCIQKCDLNKIIIEIRPVFMYNDRVVVLAPILNKTLRSLVKNGSGQKRPTTKMGCLPIKEENALWLDPG